MSAEEISIEFENMRELYEAYMPYLKSGGIFVRTARPYPMGEAVVLSVTLPDALEPEQIEGKVVWITPQANQSSTPGGIGVSFSQDKAQVQGQIEKLLGSMLKSDEPTFTI